MGKKETTVNPEVIAFVQGAKWWEYHSRKATLWPSDRRLAEEEALKREKYNTLGKHLDCFRA